MDRATKIPISDAKKIGKDKGWSQVIIVAWDKTTGTEHVTTWGESKEDCKLAADGGNWVKRAMGWPEKMCDDKPEGSSIELSESEENLFQEFTQANKEYLEYIINDWKDNIDGIDFVLPDILKRIPGGTKAHFLKTRKEASDD